MWKGLSPLSLRTLESFLALSKILNYRQTAESLFISEPSLSNQIRQLEAEYNCQLIDRSKRQIRLTPAGEQLALSATRIFDEVQRTNRLMYRFNSANNQRFTIGASGVHLVFPLSQELQAAYPKARFTFAETFNRDIIQRVTDRSLTVGFSFLDTVPKTLETSGVFIDHLVAVTRVGDPNFNGVAQLSALELLAHPLAVLRDGFYINNSVTQFFRFAGIAPSYTYTLESYHACIDQVKQQSCVTIVPRSFFDSLADSTLRGIPLAGKQPALPMGLVYLKEESANPIIRSLKRMARDLYVTGGRSH